MKTKVKLTIVVELDSPEYDNPETIMDEFVSETDYSFGETDNVQVIDTEIKDSEIIDEFDFDMDEPCKNYSVYLIPTTQPIYNDPDFGFDTVKQLAEQRFEFDEYDEANDEALKYVPNTKYYVFVVDEFDGLIL